MTAASRLISLERGLNGMAKKVLEAVPIAEAWTQHQIMAEIKRLNGTVAAFDVVQGCLSRLLDAGLIKGAGGLFQRVPIRRTLTVAGAAQPEDDDAAVESLAGVQQPEQPAPTPVDRIANIAQTLRGLSSSLAKLADELDAVGVEADDAIKAAGAGSEKLKQLRDLLAAIK